MITRLKRAFPVLILVVACAPALRSVASSPPAPDAFLAQLAGRWDFVGTVRDQPALSPRDAGLLIEPQERDGHWSQFASYTLTRVKDEARGSARGVGLRAWRMTSSAGNAARRSPP